MKYRKLKGYKYELQGPEQFRTDILLSITPAYIHLGGGKLTILSGYAWDGPSGPTFDTKTFMRGSLLHDAYYQMMREGYLDATEWRKYADEQLRRICLEDGMNKIRAWYVYRAVRIFGKFTCKPRKNPRGKVITIGLVLAMICLAGCQTTKEVVHVECNLRDGEDAPDFYYYSEIARTSFLYWNSAAGVTHTTPFTTVKVDKIETMPDANSLEAVADGAVSTIMKAGL